MPELTFDRATLRRLRKKYPGKIVAFDSEAGVICICEDTKKALAEAQEYGFPKPYIFHTSLNKLIDLGYIPDSPSEWQNNCDFPHILATFVKQIVAEPLVQKLVYGKQALNEFAGYCGSESNV